MTPTHLNLTDETIRHLLEIAKRTGKNWDDIVSDAINTLRLRTWRTLPLETETTMATPLLISLPDWARAALWKIAQPGEGLNELIERWIIEDMERLGITPQERTLTAEELVGHAPRPPGAPKIDP